MTEWSKHEAENLPDQASDVPQPSADDFDLELVEVAPVALELPVWEPTGESRVDAALDRLHDLQGQPTADHVEIYEDVHRRLGEALSDLEPSL